MTAGIPRDHHFTPVFYQKAWADAGGRVIRYSRPRDRVVAKSNAPTATGSQEDLYSLTGVPLEHQAALESQFFAPLDSRAAIAHQVLLTGRVDQLSPEERVDWARFMMSMALRNPFALGEVQQLADQTMRDTLQGKDAEFEAVRIPDDPTTILGWIEKYQPHHVDNFHKTILPELIDHDGLGSYLINMEWGLFDTSSASHSLLTGDRPFIPTHGWKDPRAALLFPVSPHLLFIATNGRRQLALAFRNATNRLARWMNDAVARRAVEFVIGTDKSQLEFVERRLRHPSEEPLPGIIGKGQPGCPAD